MNVSNFQSMPFNLIDWLIFAIRIARTLAICIQHEATRSSTAHHTHTQIQCGLLYRGLPLSLFATCWAPVNNDLMIGFLHSKWDYPQKENNQSKTNFNECIPLLLLIILQLILVRIWSSFVIVSCHIYTHKRTHKNDSSSFISFSQAMKIICYARRDYMCFFFLLLLFMLFILMYLINILMVDWVKPQKMMALDF